MEDGFGQLGTRGRHIPRSHSDFVSSLAPKACISLEEEGNASRCLDLDVQPSTGGAYSVLNTYYPRLSSDDHLPCQETIPMVLFKTTGHVSGILQKLAM